MSSEKPQKPMPDPAIINAYVEQSAARTRLRLPLAKGAAAVVRAEGGGGSGLAEATGAASDARVASGRAIGPGSPDGASRPDAVSPQTASPHPPPKPGARLKTLRTLSSAESGVRAEPAAPDTNREGEAWRPFAADGED